MGSVEIFIPYIGPSTNAMYAGQHWSKRKNHKRQALLAVISAGPLPKFAGAVSIKAIPVLGKGRRAYDVSNYSYTYKMIEDALVERGVLAGDTAKVVTSVSFSAPLRGPETGMKIEIHEQQEAAAR